MDEMKMPTKDSLEEVDMLKDTEEKMPTKDTLAASLNATIALLKTSTHTGNKPV